MGQLAPQIRALGAELVAIAVTATFSQMAFARSLEVDFPLLSDWEGTTASSYGVQYTEWKGHSGLARRSIFVVDGAGKIAFKWVTEDALIQPDLAPALAAVAELAG